MNDRKMVLDGMMGLVVGDALGCRSVSRQRGASGAWSRHRNGGLRHL